MYCLEIGTDILYWSNAEVQPSLEQLKASRPRDVDSVNEFIYNWLEQKRNGWAYAISLCSGFGSVSAIVDWAIPLCDSHRRWVHLFNPLIIVDSPSSHVTHILLWFPVLWCFTCIGCSQKSAEHWTFFPTLWLMALMVLEMEDWLYALTSLDWMFSNSETLFYHSTKCAVFFKAGTACIFRKSSERWSYIE